MESWDFQPGDVWYFPSNEGHAVLGLDNGCTYLAVYDNGTFDELYNSRGISNWLSTAPPSIVAQVSSGIAVSLTTSFDLSAMDSWNACHLLDECLAHTSCEQ